MSTWITIAAGIVVGLLWRRIGATYPFGTLADILLGITGAFAGGWLSDVLRQIGVNSQSYNWLLVLCGAGLVPWSFRGLRRHIRKSQYSRHGS